jgi:hypothetical protein
MFQAVTCYKVVLADKANRRFTSMVVQGPFCLEYQLGEETETLPGTLGIFCFDDLETARHWWRHTIAPLRLLAGKGEDPTRPRGVCHAGVVRSLAAWYERRARGVAPWPHSTVSPSSHTICVRAFTPEEILDVA